MVVKLTSNASSTLAGAITNSQTTIAIPSGDVDEFPTLAAGEWFPLVVVDNLGNREIMHCTSRTGANLTVVRGQEGTTARAFVSGSVCDLRLTAAALSNLPLASGATAVTQDPETADDTIATTSFVQSLINALKAGVASGFDTLAEIAAYITSASTGIPSRVRKLAAGDALPSSDEGPIWHPTYNSIMTWQTFNANGASYTGYASVAVGKPEQDGQSTARAGFMKLNGGSYSKTTYAALWNWALHTGNVVALGSWAGGAFVFADNGDGTFKVPDIRAMFPRNWDDGRGVDLGRAFGSSQASQNLLHNHTGITDAQGNHQHSFTGFGPGALIVGSGPGISYGTDLTAFSGAHQHNLAINNSGGTEARPLNTALLSVLKF